LTARIRKLLTSLGQLFALLLSLFAVRRVGEEGFSEDENRGRSLLAGIEPQEISRARTDRRLKIRVKLPNGSCAYIEPVFSFNNKLKPHYGLVGGKPRHQPFRNIGVYWQLDYARNPDIVRVLAVGERPIVFGQLSDI
jgi:hypothetical protein